MKIKYALISILLLGSMGIFQKTLAEDGDMVQEGGFEAVDYLEIFDEESIAIELSSDEQNPVPGMPTFITASLINTNTYPITGGRFFIKVYKVEEEEDLEKFLPFKKKSLVQEFSVEEDLTLLSEEEKVVKFHWIIPETVSTGVYALVPYLSTEDGVFQVGQRNGNDSLVNAYFFTIENPEQNDSVYWDRDSLIVEGFPLFETFSLPNDTSTGISTELSASLVNPTNQQQEVEVMYGDYSAQTMAWQEGVSPETQTITLRPGERRELKFNVTSEENVPIESSRLLARSSQGDSMVDVHFAWTPSKGVDIRGVSLDAFPQKNQPFVMGMCLDFPGKSFNDGGEAFSAEIALYDEDENLLGTYVHQGEIEQYMIGLKKEITLDKKFSTLYAGITVFDESGNRLDEAVLTYSCDDFASCSLGGTLHCWKGKIHSW